MKLPCPDHTRESRSESVLVNVVKTLIQIIIFWSFFLALVPALIVAVEARIGTGSFSSPASKAIGIGLFAVMGSIGIYCGMIFAVLGSGTPLPLDTTTKLVIVGPYRYIRNPMSVTGITQGVAVGIYLGSPLTILYSAAGYFAWNYLARPWEEADLERRFGEEYVRYQQSIKCWIPTLKPYVRSVPIKSSHLPNGDREGSQ